MIWSAIFEMNGENTFGRRLLQKWPFSSFAVSLFGLVGGTEVTLINPKLFGVNYSKVICIHSFDVDVVRFVPHQSEV